MQVEKKIENTGMKSHKGYEKERLEEVKKRVNDNEDDIETRVSSLISLRRVYVCQQFFRFHFC